jgi:CubicO group peptidase (beta-lactamase class C family)
MSTVTDRRRATARPRSPRRAPFDEAGLRTRVSQVLNRRPAVGLAVGVVRDGRLAFFAGHGVADVMSRAPITDRTVFRIASVTKLFTAVAVMQLWEQGSLDLDAPVNDVLRAYRLVRADGVSTEATLRHLLTHTAGIPEVIRLADLLRPGRGRFDARPAVMSVAADEPMPPLSNVYRRGLPCVVEPGTAFAYTNHGFATLGQVVEDVSGMPLDRYVRERILDPLGMADTDLVRADRLRARLATGYDLGRRGPEPAPDRDWVTRGASGIYSTPADLARFASALLDGGAGDGGPILRATTLATMFEPHYRPDPRVPGMGLAFFRSDLGGHRVVGHSGRLPGFTAQLLIAPDDGIGVVALTNGSTGATAWLPAETEVLLRHLLDVGDDDLRSELPHHPEVWGDLCGRYRLPERIGDLRGRALTRGGIDVFVGRGRLMARIRLPIPALYRGVPLHPDDDRDPDVFRADLSGWGMPRVRVAFARAPDGRVVAAHTDLDCLSLIRVASGLVTVMALARRASPRRSR